MFHRAPTDRVQLLRRHDDGFTLIEIILAMFLTVVVMTAVLGVLVSSLKTVAQARQRQTATALATQTLERLRALPYNSVTGSAPTFPLSGGLEYVTVAGPIATFAPSAVNPSLPGETLIVNEYSGKRTSKTIDAVPYVVQTFVTKAAPTAAGEQAFNLTAIVRWTSPVYPSIRTVAQRSTAYSPAGCLSTAQHPFAAPCQAYFTAQAGLSAGSFAVTNATDSTLDIPGLAGRAVELGLPVLSANLQIEQTASGGASAATSGARSAPGTSVGGETAAVSVDSDPSSTPAQAEQSPFLSQTAGTRSLTGAAGTLAATRSTSSAAAKAEAAIGAPACGSGLLTGPAGLPRPCAFSEVGAAPGLITYLSPTAVAVPVVSLAAAPSQARAVAANLATPNVGACSVAPGATSPGCAHSRASRSLGDFVVGGFMSADPRGLFKVTGLVETAIAERGTGAGTPSYTRSGTLSYWNGSGYTNLTIGAGASLVTVPGVISTQGGLTVQTEPFNITIQAPQLPTPTGPADCKAASCVAQVNGAGGLRALTTFTVSTGGPVSAGGTVVTTFVLVSDLGGLVAQSTYKAAPDA